MTEHAPYQLAVVAPVLAVTDMTRSLEHYTGALLFSVGFEWADAASEPIRYAVLQNGDCEVHLALSETARPSVAYVFVSGVEAYYQSVKAQDAPITCELEDQPWEMREFEVTDPDGNRLIFGEHLSRLEPA